VGDEWICEVCAKCACGKVSQLGSHDDLELVPKLAEPPSVPSEGVVVLTGEGVVVEPKKSTYLTAVCLTCLPDFDAGRFCPVCLRVHPDEFSPQQQQQQDELNRKKKKALLGYQAGGLHQQINTYWHQPPRGDTMVKCDTCERRVHYPHCDPEVLGRCDPQIYLHPFRDPVQTPYQCPICRLVAGAASLQTSTELLIDTDDEVELLAKRDRKDKLSRKKRGRPRKYPMLEEPLIKTDQEVNFTKLWGLVRYCGRVVAVPSWRGVYRWTNVQPQYNPTN
jgi:hypothetical protein